MRSHTSPRFLPILLAAALLLSGCGDDEPQPTLEVQRTEDGSPGGLPGFQKPSPSVGYGGRPGETGLSNLGAMGFGAIVSLSAEAPDAKAAGRAGLKAYHIPVSMRAITQDEAARIAAAVGSDKATYFYDATGSKRVRAAALIAQRGAEELSLNEALAIVEGGALAASALARSVLAFKPPSAAERAELRASLKSRVEVSATRAAMAEVSERWARLSEWAESDWARPKQGPTLGDAGATRPYADLSAADQAKALADRLEGLAEPKTEKPLALFRQYKADAVAASRLLEMALRKEQAERANAAMKRLDGACSMCHKRYR